jgi:RND superfamily putative drug exporter
LTRAISRARAVVLVSWGVVLVCGSVASTQLTSLLTNSFAVPGSGSDHASKLLASHFGERPEGSFIVVFPVRHSSDAVLRRRLDRRLARAARALPGGHALPLRPGGGLFYGEVATRLDFQDAKRYTQSLRRALRTAGPAALVTGQPAIQHDLDPILASDLHRGELVALPFALLVLLALFGPSPAVAIPFVIAACTVSGTLAGVWAIAHVLQTTSFVANLVTLIGFGLAVDYSLLIVHRFREELSRTGTVDDAVVRTMATAGRAVVFSGTTVAVALGMLILVPVPFIRSLGVAGALVPLLSIAAALTLQPVLLALLGRRVLAKPMFGEAARRFWQRLAPWVVGRRRLVLSASAALLLLLSLPLFALRLVPASFSGLPAAPESSRALALLREGVGPGAVTPTQIVVDAGAPGRARAAPVRRSVARLAGELVKDGEPLVVASGSRSPYVDPTRRYARLLVVGRHEYGSSQEQAFVRRLRGRYVAEARFPQGTRVVAGGAPPQGVDFLSAVYSAFPWLVLAVLAVTYLALVRAFRSVVLPLTAVVANLLPVTAAYGVLVLVFQWGVGAGLLGVERTGHVEGWIPVFLFAVMFGLSMDYEVFLVSRMREAWQRGHDNDRAVVLGLERTGRVITSAALIMAAAFAGFAAGRVPGLQQLGVGLTAAVLIDAAIVRTLLVPSLAAVLGPRNWWRPGARSSVS